MKETMHNLGDCKCNYNLRYGCSALHSSLNIDNIQDNNLTSTHSSTKSRKQVYT